MRLIMVYRYCLLPLPIIFTIPPTKQPITHRYVSLIGTTTPPNYQTTTANSANDNVLPHYYPRHPRPRNSHYRPPHPRRPSPTLPLLQEERAQHRRLAADMLRPPSRWASRRPVVLEQVERAHRGLEAGA
jgi:hypothetical protein